MVELRQTASIFRFVGVLGRAVWVGTESVCTVCTPPKGRTHTGCDRRPGGEPIRDYLRGRHS